MTDKLPPLKPSDHPEPRIMQWSKLEMEFIQDYARQAVREAVPDGFVLVKKEDAKRAPVQGWPGGIPWSLHMEAYAAYSKKWAPQEALIDLEGRNCRGGFSTGELDEFIPGWRDKVSEIYALRAEVARLIAAAKEA